MNSSVHAWRNPPSASEVTTALRRVETDPMTRDVAAPESAGLSLDAVILEISNLRTTVREAFVAASPEYQLLTELTENGLRDCAKCLRELEARAAQHPYNRMLIKIDAAYDAARRLTRANAQF